MEYWGSICKNHILCVLPRLLEEIQGGIIMERMKREVSLVLCLV